MNKQETTDQKRRIVELAVMVGVPEDWSDDAAATEAFEILVLSDEKALRPIKVAPLEWALRSTAGS